jgi:four helix bundle protein
MEILTYKFEKLEVWKISLELNDVTYEISDALPKIEEFNLKSQIIRASTSISLNIAEGSMASSNLEQKKYLRTSLRSLMEVIACLKLIERRKYLSQSDNLIIKAYEIINQLFPKLISFIKSLS